MVFLFFSSPSINMIRRVLFSYLWEAVLWGESLGYMCEYACQHCVNTFVRVHVYVYVYTCVCEAGGYCRSLPQFLSASLTAPRDYRLHWCSCPAWLWNVSTSWVLGLQASCHIYPIVVWLLRIWDLVFRLCSKYFIHWDICLATSALFCELVCPSILVGHF